MGREESVKGFTWKDGIPEIPAVFPINFEALSIEVSF
jgi:hypothetical protein